MERLFQLAVRLRSSALLRWVTLWVTRYAYGQNAAEKQHGSFPIWLPTTQKSAIDLPQQNFHCPQSMVQCAVMLAIYIFALVLGLGTLCLQFFLAGHGDADVSADADIGGGVDGDLGGDTGGGVGGDAHVSSGAGDAASAASAGAFGPGTIFLSMRFWTFALMAFGFVGTPLSIFGLASFLTTLITAIIAGLASGITAAMLFSSLKKPVSSTTGQGDLVGKIAVVTVPVRKGSVGKVQLTAKGNRVDILAKSDTDLIDTGEEVVVIDFRDAIACVEPIGKSEA
ncbi:MAG: NfeD family protein [Polyangiaceae bacterium]|nr:NfeD family protein [Polyangiaceae bacterium]